MYFLKVYFSNSLLPGTNLQPRLTTCTHWIDRHLSPIEKACLLDLSLEAKLPFWSLKLNSILQLDYLFRKSYLLYFSCLRFSRVSILDTLFWDFPYLFYSSPALRRMPPHTMTLQNIIIYCQLAYLSRIYIQIQVSKV